MERDFRRYSMPTSSLHPHLHTRVHTYTCARTHMCTHMCVHTQRYIYTQYTHKENCIVAHTSKTWEAGELPKVPGQLGLQNESLSHNTTTSTGEVTRKGKANDAEVYSLSLNSRTTEEGENQLLEICPLLSTHTHHLREYMDAHTQRSINSLIKIKEEQFLWLWLSVHVRVALMPSDPRQGRTSQQSLPQGRLSTSCWPESKKRQVGPRFQRPLLRHTTSDLTSFY